LDAPIFVGIRIQFEFDVFCFEFNNIQLPTFWQQKINNLTTTERSVIFSIYFLFFLFISVAYSDPVVSWSTNDTKTLLFVFGLFIFDN